MSLPTDLKYTKDHEWVRIEGDYAFVGITEFAQSELGELVYVEVDTLGDDIAIGEVFGTVEAVKTTSDLFMPLSGVVEEFNPQLDESEADNPGLINEDPYGEGWIVKIKMTHTDELLELLDHQEYAALIGS